MKKKQNHVGGHEELGAGSLVQRQSQRTHTHTHTANLSHAHTVTQLDPGQTLRDVQYIRVKCIAFDFVRSLQ